MSAPSGRPGRAGGSRRRNSTRCGKRRSRRRSGAAFRFGRPAWTSSSHQPAELGQPREAARNRRDGLLPHRRGAGRRRLPACDRGGRDRRRRRQAADPPPVPHRARYDQPRASRRDRDRTRFFHRSHRLRPELRRTGGPRRSASSNRTSTTRRQRSARRSTSPTSPGARSAGCPTSFAGRRLWPTCLSPAASSISPKAIRSRSAWRKSRAGSCRTMPGGRHSTRRSSTKARRPIRATRARSTHRRSYNWIHPLSDILAALGQARACGWTGCTSTSSCPTGCSR